MVGEPSQHGIVGGRGRSRRRVSRRVCRAVPDGVTVNQRQGIGARCIDDITISGILNRSATGSIREIVSAGHGRSRPEPVVMRIPRPRSLRRDRSAEGLGRCSTAAFTREREPCRFAVKLYGVIPGIVRCEKFRRPSQRHVRRDVAARRVRTSDDVVTRNGISVAFRPALISPIGGLRDVERRSDRNRRGREPISVSLAHLPCLTVDFTCQFTIRTGQLIPINNLNRGTGRKRLGQHHEGRCGERDGLIGGAVNRDRKGLGKVRRSAVGVPRVGSQRVGRRAIDAFEGDFRDAAGQHVAARGEPHGGERVGEGQGNGSRGIAGHCGSCGDEQVLLVGYSPRNRIGEGRSTGLRPLGEPDAVALIGRVGEEADVATGTGPVIGCRPRGGFRNLDIVHIIRQAGSLVPTARENVCQHAERIVHRRRPDGCGTGLQPVAGLCILVLGGDTFGYRSVQEQRVGRILPLQGENSGMQPLIGRILGCTGLHCGFPTVRRGYLETQRTTRCGTLQGLLRAGRRKQRCGRNEEQQMSCRNQFHIVRLFNLFQL